MRRAIWRQTGAMLAGLIAICSLGLMVTAQCYENVVISGLAANGADFNGLELEFDGMVDGRPAYALSGSYIADMAYSDPWWMLQLTNVVASEYAIYISNVSTETPPHSGWQLADGAWSWGTPSISGGGVCDTEKPSVTDVILSDRILSAADAPGTATFVITVEFSEAMDANTGPVIAFDPGTAGTLVLNAGASGWVDSDTYEARYDVVDVDAEVFDIEITICCAQDVAGNAQWDLIDRVGFDIDMVSPVMSTILRKTPTSNITNADTVTFEVTFSENVANCHAADFGANGPTGASTVVTGSDDTYEVTVLGGNMANLDSFVQLVLSAGQDIEDLAGNPITHTTVTGYEQSFILDNTSPLISSILRKTPTSAYTNADTVTFEVTFDETVANCDASDFEAEGPTGASTLLTGSGDTFQVTVLGGDMASLDSIVRLVLSAGQDIEDSAGNVITHTTVTGLEEIFILDNTTPVISSILRKTPTSAYTNADTVTFEVTFDETVANCDASDFEASGPTGASTVVSGSDDTYEVTVLGGDMASLDSIVRLVLSAGQDIEDSAGNVITHTTVTGLEEIFILDNTAPVTLSILRKTPMSEHTDSDTVTFAVSFSEDVSQVGASDFDVSGPTGATIDVSGWSSDTYDVTISGGDMADLNAVVAIALSGSQDIVDKAGNELASTTPIGTEEAYLLVNTASTDTGPTTQVTYLQIERMTCLENQLELLVVNTGIETYSGAAEVCFGLSYDETWVPESDTWFYCELLGHMEIAADARVVIEIEVPEIPDWALSILGNRLEYVWTDYVDRDPERDYLGTIFSLDDESIYGFLSLEMICAEP